MADDSTRLELCSKLKDFHRQDKLTDFVIVCGDRKWNVHRFVLALHSDVLRRACSSGFKEAHERLIDLSADHDPVVIEALVEYMYTFNYSVYSLDELEAIELHANLYLLGDKYNIEGLCEVATDAFISLLKGPPEVLAKAAKVAYAYPDVTTILCEELVDAVVERKELLSNGKGTVLLSAMRENDSFARDVEKIIAFEPVRKRLALVPDR
ncbi:hypothetical protein CKM354_000686100 [Cercospora kikuchii]|uniref:BTB domain-containing protein n=1 Tax=Cercospora kikuchii TaxID=84275 RepID=A0A9P3CG16_9PEZI|nr:uncharacterized protein CKM354_000686100 [Cercospora kikuchii]GIZ43644.1 hypothetical protein CKM354_000686100 [Cercospora kikuchii]